MSVVKHSLDLTDDQIWDSNIAYVYASPRRPRYLTPPTALSL